MRGDDDEDGDYRPSVDAKRMRDALALASKHPEPYHRPEPRACAVCGALTVILHRLDGQHRTVCGVCQGKANRDRLDAMARAVRVLKTSDDASELKAAEAMILRFDNFPRETLAAIRAQREGKKGKRFT